jgi:hypothetical protein
MEKLRELAGNVLFISSFTGEGIKDLLEGIWALLKKT